MGFESGPSTAIQIWSATGTFWPWSFQSSWFSPLPWSTVIMSVVFSL
jgi:hypothetical protein